MKKTKVKMNKPVYLGMSILDISKALINKFWHDQIKQKYHDKAKLCCIDTGSFAIPIKTEDFYNDIANDVEKWFHTSNYDEDDKIPLPIGLLKMNQEEKIMKEFVGPRAKKWTIIRNIKKRKEQKKCVI